MTKKEGAASSAKPWEGLMSKENYDKATSGLTKEQKRNFDLGLATRDVDQLMGLRLMGLYDPTKPVTKKRGGARGRKNGAKN